MSASSDGSTPARASASCRRITGAIGNQTVRWRKPSSRGLVSRRAEAGGGRRPRGCGTNAGLVRGGACHHLVDQGAKSTGRVQAPQLGAAGGRTAAEGAVSDQVFEGPAQLFVGDRACA